MNEIIKETAKNKGVKLYEIAFRCGCNDGNFSRKLRREMTVAEQRQILQIIDQIAKEREAV